MTYMHRKDKGATRSKAKKREKEKKKGDELPLR